MKWPFGYAKVRYRGLAKNNDGGALGDGYAKWRLEIESDQPVHVMGLLRSPTGHLTNLSSSPYRIVEPTPGTASRRTRPSNPTPLRGGVGTERAGTSNSRRTARPRSFRNRARPWCGRAVAGLVLWTAAVEAGPATGKPTISGPPQVGETLTVDTGDIADTDGLGAFSYQWIRVGVGSISGATSTTYMPLESDVGRKLKVRVSFTDDGGAAESVTSDAYPSNGYPWDDIGIAARKTTCPTDHDWCAEMTVGFAHEPGTGKHIYYWGYGPQHNSPSYGGAVSDSTMSHDEATYTFTEAQLTAYSNGVSKFTIGFNDEKVPDETIFKLGGATLTLHGDSRRYGNSYWVDFPAGLRLITGAKMTVSVKFPTSATPATGQPSITGAPQVGGTLSADTGDIADPDGLGAFSYQWIRLKGGNEVDIPGATGSTYAPVAADIGDKLKVRASFTDGSGHEESVTSDAHPAVGYPWNSLGVAASKTTCPEDDHWCAELTVGYGETTGQLHYGFTPQSVFGSDSTSRFWGELSTRVLTYGGTTLKFRQLGIAHKVPGGYPVVYAIFNDSARVPAGTVFRFGTIAFRATESQYLNYGPGRKGYAFYSLRGLTMVESEKITVSVKFPDHATGQPSITGTPHEGRTLGVSTDGIEDVHGNTKADDAEAGYAYTYQWIRVDGDTETQIGNATSGTYTLTADDVGWKVRVQVSFTDDAGNAEAVTSDPWPTNGTVFAASTRVTLSLSPSSVDEDAASTPVAVTGTLDGVAHTSDISVTVTVGGTGDTATEGTDYATVADLTLTIPAGRVSGTATFRLNPTDDDLDEAHETLSVRGSTTGLTVAGTTATLVDDDTRRVRVSDTALTVAEGGTATYTVALESQPHGTVTVTPSLASGSDDVGFGPASLRFPADDWKTAQTVTVSTAEDADAEDAEATIAHAVTGADYASTAAASVSVTVTDDETVAETVVLSLSPDSVDEDAGSTPIAVTGTLDGIARTTATAVTVAVGDTGDTATKGTDYDAVDVVALTIAAGSISGTATFALAPTDDAVDEAHETLSVAGTTTAAGLTVAATMATIVDDDTRGVEVSTASLTVPEGGSASYTVALASRPTAAVTVTPSLASRSGDVTISPSHLSFRAHDWDAARTITVSAAEDDDAAQDDATISHAVAGGDYASVNADSVSVMVADNETASESVTLSLSPASVAENAESATVTVTGVLDAAPRTSDIAVSVSVGAPTDTAMEGTDYGSVGPLTLTIAADRISGTAIFRLVPTDDAVDEANETLSVTGTTPAAGLTVMGATATIVDDDTRGVHVSAASLVVDEGGSANYTVRLATQPTAPVILSADVAAESPVAVSPDSLTFASADWHAARTVTVTAAEDADAENEAGTVTHTARGGGYGAVQAPSVLVSVRDDDRRLVLAGARARGNEVTMTFDQPLDGASIPAAGDFDVQIDGRNGSGGGAVDVVNVLVVAETVTLTIARALATGEQVAVRYFPGTNPIRSGAGIAVGPFTVRATLPAPGAASTPRALVFESTANPNRQGFVRIINRSAVSGEVEVAATDDAGMRADPVDLTIDAGAAAHFNSNDLEGGNPEKGLAEGVGPASLGDWRLELTSGLDIEVLSYARTRDGFVTSLHDTVPVQAGVHRGVVFFNPADNVNQESRLRLVNPNTTDANVTITGTDDTGEASEEVQVAVVAGTAVDLTASELESGTGRGIERGALGQGVGKWRLQATSDTPIVVMSLLESQGRLTNLSTAPQIPGRAEGSLAVMLFPSASDPELQGFVRVINRTGESGTVRIEAFDDTDIVYDEVTLTIGAGEVGSFNSDDLEMGNTDKGLTGSTGAGQGDWRLELASDLDIVVLAYLRTDDGFVTAIHDLAPVVDGVHRVVFLNPAANTNQVSRIRIVNPGDADAAVTITGIDGTGASPGEPVRATVSAGTALELTAVELETGVGEGIDGGALGDGYAKWRLQIESDQPVHVMSLLRSPTGHLTNLSSSPYRIVEPTPQAP